MARQSVFSIGITLAVLLTISLVLHAQEKKAAVVSGTWKWTVQFGGNPVETTLKLKQDGEKLTGTITGFQGQETDIKDGTFKDDKVAFKVVCDFGGQTSTTTYVGTLSGDSLKLKAETVSTRDIDAKRAGD